MGPAVLHRTRIGFDDSQSTESLVAHVDSRDVKSLRMVVFDHDEVERATAELERLHAEFESAGA